MELKSTPILNSILAAGTRNRGCCRVPLDEEFRSHVRKVGIYLSGNFCPLALKTVANPGLPRGA
jgi:hypothetical protein